MAQTKEQQKEYSRKHYAANRDKYLARGKERYERVKGTPEYIATRKAWQLQSRYGLSMEEFDAIHEAQCGGCAICGTQGADTGEGLLYVDHDHETNKVRGLLCGNCNKALGLLRESPFALESAIVYLANAQGGGATSWLTAPITAQI